jgi:hypothetical protein
MAAPKNADKLLIRNRNDQPRSALDTSHASRVEPGIQSQSRRTIMTKMPPVPPEQRSNKGPGSDPNFQVEEEISGRENFDQQGRHGNIKQNTTNQGYQQDR